MLAKKRITICLEGTDQPHRVAWYGPAEAEAVEDTIKKVLLALSPDLWLAYPGEDHLEGLRRGRGHNLRLSARGRNLPGTSILIALGLCPRRRATLL